MRRGNPTAAMTQKTALITGASSGIGYELAKSLAGRGYKVYGCAPAKFVAQMDPLKELGVVPFALDITKTEDVSKAAEWFAKETGGKLDLLYNNAGMAVSCPTLAMTDDDARHLVEVNLTGHILVTQHFGQMVIRAKGTIVYTASVAAILPVPWVNVYCATKAGLDHYACGLRNELAPFGVRVHCVITGAVATDVFNSESKFMKRVEGTMFDFPEMHQITPPDKEMVGGGTDPAEYVEKVLNKVLGNYSEFRIYEGQGAGASRYTAMLPFNVQHSFLAKSLKLDKVYKIWRKHANDEL